MATLQVTDPEALVGDATVSWQVTAAGLATTPLVLNEYNAVTPTAQLGDGAGSDVVFGSLDGNGGDWLELVVVDDADLRGVQLQLWDRDRANDGFAMTDTLVFADVPRSPTCLEARSSPSPKTVQKTCRSIQPMTTGTSKPT